MSRLLCHLLLERQDVVCQLVHCSPYEELVVPDMTPDCA